MNEEELKGKNLFEYNGIIYTDNIPKNMFISITKEQYIEYIQLKKEIEEKNMTINKMAKDISIQLKEIEKLKREVKTLGEELGYE